MCVCVRVCVCVCVCAEAYLHAVTPPKGCEAHGGYSFCAFAALVAIRREDCIDIENLLVGIWVWDEYNCVCGGGMCVE